MSSGVPDSVVEENLDIKVTKSCSKDVNPTKNGNVDAKPHSELMKLCEEMDAEGLRKFILDNRKNLGSIREEIPSALRSATKPFSLVLDSLKDFYSGEILGLDGKKDGNLLGLRRTCLMLMESLEQLQVDSALGSLFDNQMLTLEIRERAKVIATEW